MVGLTSQIRREDMIPTTIAAGCDMILYYRDKDEDTQALKMGLEKGILTMERLDEAVTRVLAFKAMLKLHTKKANATLIPLVEGLSVIGCEEHKEVAKDLMDKAITLVKNTKNQLPITPETHKRIMLYTIENGGFAPNKVAKASLQDRVKSELEAQGFEVDVFDNSAELNGKQLLASTPVKEFVNKYDAVVIDAFSAASKIDDFVTSPAQNFAHATAIFVAQNKGAKQYKRAKKGFGAGIGLNLIYGVIITIVLFFTKEYLLNLFISYKTSCKFSSFTLSKPLEIFFSKSISSHFSPNNSPIRIPVPSRTTMIFLQWRYSGDDSKKFIKT